MRRSLWGALVAALMVVVALVVGALWLPSVHARQARAWAAAGHRAIVSARLPEQYREYRVLHEGSSVFVCGPPGARCFVTSGDPRDNVTVAREVLGALATGPIQVRCGPDGGFAVAPDKCRLQVPVEGSRLDVFLYARFHMPTSLPVRASDFDGTILQVVVAPRH
jgi:hypothetical protein